MVLLWVNAGKEQEGGVVSNAKEDRAAIIEISNFQWNLSEF
jgi:hypothetical protein